MPGEFTVQHQVEFSETDMAGIVHFTNFFKYMEKVEHAFFRSLGFSIVMDRHDPPVGFPRVHAECDFHRPLKFEDLIDIHLRLTELRDKTMTYQVAVYKRQPGPEMEVARGKFVIVCVTKKPDGTMSSLSIPESIAKQLEVVDPLPAR